MSHYIVVSNNNVFQIKEIQTDQVICEYETMPIANKNCKFMNKGGWFRGFTPGFVLDKQWVTKKR